MRVAGMLEARGHEVRAYHDDVSNPAPIPLGGVGFGDMALRQPTSEELLPFIAELESFDPDVVGVSYCTADRLSALAVAWEAAVRGYRVVGGGIHPSLLGRQECEILDAVVVGEGDHPAAAAVFETDFTGELVVPKVDDLDATPTARECVIGWERYTSFLRGMVQTQRGCPYSCGYCATPRVFGSRVRRRDPGAVREEVEELGVSGGRIIDDSFGVVWPHGEGVCRELGRTNFSWVCDMALQDITVGRLQTMRAGGCTGVNLGIESAVARWRELSGKHVVPGRPEEVVREAAECGVGVVYYFMVGYPSETVDEMTQTLDLAERLRDLGARACISVVTPYPKTRLWEAAYGSGEVPADFDWSGHIHQSSRMGLGACTTEQWGAILERADRLNH